MKMIIMPRLGWDMEMGRVVEWVKREGDEVKQGEIVVKIMSQKVTYEVPGPASGLLYRIIVPPETDVPVGEVIGVIKELVDSSSVVDDAVKRAEITLMLRQKLELKPSEGEQKYLHLLENSLKRRVGLH